MLDVVPEALLSFSCGEKTCAAYVRGLHSPRQECYQLRASWKPKESSHTSNGAGLRQCPWTRSRGTTRICNSVAPLRSAGSCTASAHLNRKAGLSAATLPTKHILISSLKLQAMKCGCVYFRTFLLSKSGVFLQIFGWDANFFKRALTAAVIWHALTLAFLCGFSARLSESDRDLLRFFRNAAAAAAAAGRPWAAAAGRCWAAASGTWRRLSHL